MLGQVPEKILVLIDKLDNELNSAHHYLELAEEEMDPIEMQCLISIAQDDYQHAQFIMDMMQEDGYHVPESSKAEAEKVKAYLRKFRKI